MAGSARLVELDPVSFSNLKKGIKAADAETKKELKELHKRRAEEVARVAQQWVPYKSGELRRTIRGGAQQAGGVVRAGSTTKPYAPVIHWGWPKRGIRRRPFIVQALATISKESEGGWEGEYLDEILDILVKNLPYSEKRN